MTKQQPPDTAAARRARHRAEGRRSRLDWRHEPQDDCADCCGLMLTDRTGQTIRALKHVGSLYSWLPAVRYSRSTDRHAPCALPTAESVLKVHSNLPAQLSVPEFCSSIMIPISSKFYRRSSARLQCKPVKAAQDGCSSAT